MLAIVYRGRKLLNAHRRLLLNNREPRLAGVGAGVRNIGGLKQRGSKFEVRDTGFKIMYRTYQVCNGMYVRTYAFSVFVKRENPRINSLPE